MRFEQNGIALWYGTPDAPAPGELVLAGASGRAIGLTVTVGVQPIAARNTVLVRYRVNGDTERTVPAWLARTDVRAKAQYFEARLPEFNVGDTVEYSALCNCGGQQVPSPEQAGKLVSSFRVVPTALRSGPHPAVAMEAGPAAAGVVSSPIQPSAPAGVIARSALASVGIGALPSVPVTGVGATAIAPLAHLGGTNLGGTVLDNLKAAGPAQSFMSDRLNAALMAKLTNAAASAGHSELASVLPALPAADIAANKDLSLSEFVSKEVTARADPGARAATQPAIAKLSSKTTVSDLLGLNSNLKDHPLFTAEVHKVNLGTLLGTSPTLTNVQLQEDFIQSYASFKGSIKDFWSQLSQDSKFKPIVPELQFTLQLGALTLNNPALVTALRAKFQPKIPRDLTQLSANDWTQLITGQKIAVPDAIPGATPADKTSNYISGIVGVLKAAFPTDYIAQGIAQLASTDQDPTQLGVSQFLKNSPDFNLLTTNVDAYIGKRAATAFQNIPAAQHKGVTNELKAYQRISRVSTDFEVMTTLRGAGFHSAHSVAMMPRSAFIQKFSGQFGSATHAAVIHAGAQHITASALSLFGNVRLVLNHAIPVVLGAVGNQVQAALNASGIPNWQTLFGSLSYCSCQDCRSVLSASAYFVDLLQFLDSSPTNPTNPLMYTDPSTGATKALTPLHVLVGNKAENIAGRRPDLPYIKLNCENTNTPLPYLDLVNEILESFVVLNGKLSPTTAKNTPSDATADQLSVNPQYTNGSAYVTLKTAFYPQTLPFDRWLETARTYLQFMNTSLYEVMSAFQVGGDPSDTTKGQPSGLGLACEYLRISEAEYTILTGADFLGNAASPARSLFQYYGYAGPTVGSASWKQDVAQVPQFLRRTSIVYTDLVALLETQFINPTQSITLQASGSDLCDLTQTAIVDASASNEVLQDATLNRMHRFIRLSRKLGWAMDGLDKAITALGATDIDQALVVSLAQVQQLARSLNLPLNQLLSFWSNINTDGTGSLYIQLFQNRAVINPVDLAFQLDYASTLKSLPKGGVVFPGPLSAQVIYDPVGKQLNFTSNPMTADQMALVEAPMTSDQRGLLLSLSTDNDYQSAVNALFNAQSASAAAPLASLPAGLSLPARLPGTVYYDGPNLHFIGLMADAQRDLLLGLASDAQYPLAVDNLSNARSFPGPAVAVAQTSASIKDHFGTILAALRIGADDLTAIGTATGLYNASAGAWANLSLENLSALYRYALLASAVGLAPKDLISLITLTGAVPFQAASPAPTLAFVQRVKKFQSSPFSASQLNYIYRDLYDPNAGIAPLPADVTLLLVTLQVGLAKIAVDNTPAPDPNGDLLRRKLASLLGSSLADAAMGLINGMGVYSAALASLSNITFPTPLPISYDSTGLQLRFAGPMTAAQQAGLLALSADPKYQGAMNSLFQQPRDFISQNLASFLDPADAVIQLIENPQKLDAAGKTAYVLERLMPYLRQTLSQGLIKQMLSDNLQLDPKLTNLLLGTVLESQMNPTTQQAIADFLALAGDGLSATYFPNQTLTGPPALTQVHPTVDFNWGFGLPDPSISSKPFSVRWSGFVLPQYTEPYTFYVRAGDGVRLWVDDQLLIDQWADQSPTEHSGIIALTAGELASIKLEYYDNTASAAAVLRWSSPSAPKAVIPETQLFSGRQFKSLAPIINSYLLLFKITLLAKTFRMTADDLPYLSAHSADFSSFDLNALPLNRTYSTAPGIDANAPNLLAQWERLNALFGVRNNLPGGDVGLLNILAVAAASTAPTKLSDSTTQAVVQAAGWDPGELQTLTAGFGLGDQDFKNEAGTKGIGLVQLAIAMRLISRLGVSSKQLLSWANLRENPALEPGIAQDIKSTVKARYDDSTWVTVGKPLNDKLREASKEALIAYILANASAWAMTALDGGPITTSDQLYEYFLIDVDMSPCMTTSRIVQANAAIQLFVQRVLMNLENGNTNPALNVSPAAIDASQWEWRKNYRVWQANREVFLYPENWIVPELRDDKTPFFRELEADLLQSDVTADNVEQVYLNYLNKLDEVARLEICGTYWQIETELSTGDRINIFHTFGRTCATPHVYYYRQLDLNTGVWNVWERVDVGIQGDHLVPVVWNRRLYIFWPMFKETADTTSPGTIQVPNAGDPNYSPPAPMKKLEVSLAWSEYQQGKWSKKQVSSDSLTPYLNTEHYSSYSDALDPSVFVFNASVDKNNNLWINLFESGLASSSVTEPSGQFTVSTPPPVLVQIGQFTFFGCNSAPTPSPSNGQVVAGLIVPENSSFQYNSLAEWIPGAGVGDLALTSPLDPYQYQLALMSGNSTSGSTSADVPTLGETPSPYDLIFPQQFFPSFSLLPFFYQDAQRTYFVTASLPVPWLQVASATAVIPIQSATQLAMQTTAKDFGSVPVFDTSLPPASSSKSALGSQRLVSGLPAPARATAGGVRLSTGVTFTGPAATGSAAGNPGRGPAPTGGHAIALTGSSLSTSSGPGSILRSVSGPASEVWKGLFASSPQVTFATHYHPHVCAFIKALNWQGLPALLALPRQQLTNDGGVISGLTLSTSQTATPGIGAGALYAQTQLFVFPTPPSLPPAPAGQSFLFYNSGPSRTPASGKSDPRRPPPKLPGSGFYYSSLATPDSPEDALIGKVTASPAITAVQPWSAFSLPTLFNETYFPNTSVVATPYPKEDVDFSYGGAYSIYNWELFFHIPLLLAIRLSQNQKFEDAQKWFHYIFNPTSNAADPSPQRYWNLLPFYRCSVSDEVEGQLQNLLMQLDTGGGASQPSECGLDLSTQVTQWEGNAFNPHLVARMRTIAYRKAVVMKYLDNLIAWGDYLFRQNTRESINEATQVYVLAHEILGPRPTQIPERGTIQDYTYHDLTTQFSLDEFSNALVQMENVFPFTTSGASINGSNSGLSSATSTATTSFYFCIPPDGQLLGYWDTVEDRLYKIRHCMNIAGAVEQLPLFAPPISPALLVQAEAMGVDLDSVLSDINAPAPNYRFTYMVQKALEICSEVRSLGAGILAALEKKDAEHLAYLRATQETSLLTKVRQIKQSQVQEANDTLQGLQASRAVTLNRQTYYQSLINGGLSQFELQQIFGITNAQGRQDSSVDTAYLTSGLALIPNVDLGVSGFGGSPVASITFGSAQLVAYLNAEGQAASLDAGFFSYGAGLASILGGWDRRAQDWNFQVQSAGLELASIDPQIAAANIRVQIAQTDLDNQDLQIQNAQDVQDFLESKFTAEDLYSWMVDQTSTVYFQCYQLAYETAKKAEKAFQFDRGLTDSSYIQFGYWDSLKKGLLAGERLYMDLKRMEMAYLDLNTRDYEITKYASLVLLDPLALIALKETGHCLVNLPESLFDMDYPGHYLRRLKSVSLTLPCVTGPYTSVNCTLMLLTSKIRIDNIASSPQDYASDAHFITNFAATQSIATSSAQNDSGMFELNFRDERYLPFEGAGVISTWQIDLPPDTNAFDFETISDVVINLRYSARDGGATLADVARKAAVMPTFALQAGPPTAPTPFPPQTNLGRLFSLKHEFSSEWYKFLNPQDTATSQSMQIALTIERFPYQYRGRKITISRVELFLKLKDLNDPETYTYDGTPLGDYVNAGSPLVISLTTPTGSAQSGTLASASTFLNGLPFAAVTFPAGSPPGLGNWTLRANNANIQKIASSLQNIVTSGGSTFQHLNPAAIDDIVMVCHYSA
jgi:hypothetical protein